MKNEPTIVINRKNHFKSGSAAPLSALCQEPGERKRPRVAIEKPPIHRTGNRNFMKNVSADERVCSSVVMAVHRAAGAGGETQRACISCCDAPTRRARPGAGAAERH